MDKKEQAKKMYEKGCQYKEIATSLDISINTLKSWKKRNNWQRGGATLGMQPSSRGAPLGNKNAKGNSGGGASEGNSNALKTGEYEKIYFDLLSDDEKSIYSIDFSLSERLEQDIQELTMRKYRMMKRIKSVENGLDLVEAEKLYELRGRKQYVDSEKGGKKISIEVPQVTMTEMKEKSIRKIEDILRIEDALTRISNQLTRTIKQLSDVQLNEYKTKLIMGQAYKMSAEAEMAQHEADKLTNSNAGNNLLKALLDVKSGGDGSSGNHIQSEAD